MQIEWQIASISEWQGHALIFFAFEQPCEYLPALRSFLDSSGKWLANSRALTDFRGKPSEVAVMYAPDAASPPRVLLVGLGPAERFETERLKNASAFAFRKCSELGIVRPAIPLSALEGFPGENEASGLSPCGLHGLLRETLAGALAGLHQFNELKTQNSTSPTNIESLELLCTSPPESSLRDVATLARCEVAGIKLARDLTISPANRVTPAFLAQTASGLADRFGFKIQIIDLDTARSMGMGAFAAVAAGSAEPPFFIVLEHSPPGTENDSPLVLIGKGITFDSGGISLKPREKMEEMKQDMAGAAAVLGVFEALGSAGLGKRVVGILPCTENMPGGKAYKPGDVLRSYSGRTIEIISTDAEGRLVLCDALAYAAQRFKPALMVDIATLTGASIVALGRDVAAIMGNREPLVEFIQKIGASVGERFWPLPLWDFFFDGLKSEVADMKNTGDRGAGAIYAAMFLKQFVPDQTPWAHLDIAGTAWTDKDTGFCRKGSTGFGVRTLFSLVRRAGEWGKEPESR
jgi:leucyl aminopeptidase